MAKLSACIITLNEEQGIETCLNSLRFADEIIVVDSGSSDRTVELAKRFTEKVYVNKFKNFSNQKNFAIEKASGEWILSIDADEIVTEELAREICSAINFDTHICGYNINRINHMYGKQLDHFSQPDYKMRLFRKEKGRFVQPVHEYVKLEGEAGHLKNPFIHYSIANFAEHWQKTDLYTRFEVDITRKRYGLNPARCLVEVVFKPPFRLLQNYILLKGFREGLTGLVISVNASLAEFLRCFRCLVASFRERKATKTWSDFYNEPADTSYYWENITIHKDFLGEVLKSKPNRILEIGAGSGTLSVFLNHMGSEAIAVDKDKAVLERAEEASRALNGKVKFEIADAFNLPYEDKEFDVSFSQGVLEHFQDEDIVRILKEQTRVAKAVFFSVPNKYYNHRDFGNERLLTKEEWEKILSNFKITLSKYYYIVRAKRNFLTKLPIMYMAGIK